MLKNWKPLVYALLMAFMRWLQDELDKNDKKQLRQRERIIFPEDQAKMEELRKMDALTEDEDENLP